MKTTYINSIAKIQIGFQAKRKIETDPEAPYCLIQAKDIDDANTIIFDDLGRFHPDRAPNKYLVNKDNILFQARGSSHFASLVTKETYNTLASGSFFIITAQADMIFPEYLCWWMNQSKSQAYFNSQAKGSDISFVSKKELARLKVPVPDLRIQKKIIRTMAAWSREKALLARQIELKDKLINQVCMKPLLK
jgi:hypothetical protein